MVVLDNIWSYLVIFHHNFSSSFFVINVKKNQNQGRGQNPFGVFPHKFVQIGEEKPEASSLPKGGVALVDGLKILALPAM